MLRKSLLRLYYYFKNDVITDFDGEFGYELISVLPFTYWLHTQGKLQKSISCKDTKSLYYFSDNHTEKYDCRDYRIPSKFPVNNIHRRFLNTTMWSPPPLKKHYKNDEFIYDKKLLIICNKYNSEWGNPPITYLSVDCLRDLLTLLTPEYKVVYCRPFNTEIIDDNSEIYSLNDHEMIEKEFPDVMFIQDLFKNQSKYTFNELQCKLFANADQFISIQGGYSIFCSYFKGTNIIYGAKSKVRTADEIIYKAYDRWYHKFSGSKIVYVPTYNDLIQNVKKEFLHSKVLISTIKN